MDYGEIIRTAFETVKKRRYLWWLGLLAAITEGGIVNISQLPNYSTNEGDEATKGFLSSLDWLSGRPAIIWIIVASIVLLVISLIYISLTSRAGLINSTDRIQAHESEWRFKDAFLSGRPFVWRLLGLSLLYFVSIMALISVFTVPVIFMFLSKQPVVITLAVLLIVLGCLSLFALSVYIAATDPITQREIILKKKTIFSGLAASYKLILKKIGALLIAYLVSFGIGIGYSIFLGAILMIVGGILFGLGYLLSLINYHLMVSYAVVMGSAFFVFLLVIGGVFSAFVSSYWTIVYRQLSDGSK